jgi:menaquinone-dependent protoporphyrinogen oxidase
MSRWHKDARRFLSRHREALSERPVVILALGPFATGDEKEWQGSREQLDKELAEFPWLTPVSLGILGGKFDPATLGFPYNPFMHQVPASDFRGWTAIRAWASSLAAKR